MDIRLITVVLGICVCSASNVWADDVRWKMASSFPGSLPIVGDLGLRFEEQISSISDGEMEVKFFEPGALVPPLEIFDAVSTGAVEAGWTSPGYWAGKIPALQIFSALPFGPLPEAHMDWMWRGGGYELMNEIYGHYNIKSIPCGVMTSEGFGWFTKEIKTVEDLKGLKMRFFGPGAKVMEKLGASTQLLAGGDIFPALELGTIDATEFSTPYIDRLLGFHELAPYYYYPSWHQRAGMMELMINLDRWLSLSAIQQSLLEEVCKLNTLFGLMEQATAVPDALDELVNLGVRVQKTPSTILEAARTAWEEVAAEMTESDADFGRVYTAQRAYLRDIEHLDLAQDGWVAEMPEEARIAEEKRLAEETRIAEEIRSDAQQETQALLTKAEKGSAEAQYELAEKYYYGSGGVNANNSKALTWYTKAAEQDHAEAQYTLALFYKNGEVVSRNSSTALSWARKAHLNGSAAAGEMYSELLLEDFVYGNDVEALKNLADYVEVNCKSDIKCAFDRVWFHMDLTGDGNLSLAEIARFQRILVKLAAVEQEEAELEVGEILGINIASILLLPITASSIVHSFDYDNDGLLSPNEVLGDTAFAKLVGIDAESLAAGVDFEGIGNRLRESFSRVPFFK